MNPENYQTEITRIKEEYARRHNEIPSDFYSSDNPANRFMISKRKDAVLKLLKREGRIPLTGLKILDVGCGRGDWLADFKEWGVSENSLCGIEILQDRLSEAVRRFPAAELKLGNGSDLPWADGVFDLVLQSTVFSSILETSLKQRLAKEMFRVLKPEGFILWYDFSVNNPWNGSVSGVTAGEIKKLFPAADIQTEKITLAPPITRMFAGFAWNFCVFLEKIRILNTHLLAVIKKKE